MRAKLFSMLLTALVLVGTATSARADSIKNGLFGLGIQMGGAEGVASEFVGRPTANHPGAIALVKRNLMNAIAITDTIKSPAPELKTMLADVDRLSFADMESTLATLRLSYQAKFAKEINPGAGAYFTIGVQQSGAERIALEAAGFPNNQRPGSAALIGRNLTWIKDGATTLGLSVPPVVALQSDLATGVPFSVMAKKLGELRLKWQDEISAQPGFGGVGTGGGTPSTALTGTLSAPNANSKGVNPHVLSLQPGRRYTIELQSGDGATRRLPDNRLVAMPGYFDSVLVVQDERGTFLQSNDDISWPKNCNSRVSIVAPASGTVRVLVSSFNNGENGPYAIQVRPE